MSSTTSIVTLLLATSAFVAFYAFVVSRIRARSLLVLLAAASVTAAGFAVWSVDVNIPLGLSHWHPGGEPANLPVALAAMLGRLAPLCAIAMLPRRFAELRGAEV
jgi:hypothetical protein